MINIRASGSSIEKGESLRDTVQTLTAYEPAAIVIRSPYAGAAALVSQWTDAAVVNAGDGKHEHPTQALLDVFTLQSRLGKLDGLNIWIVGDVLHSRVARSDIIAFQKMGAEVTVAGPPTLLPRGIEALGCQAAPTLDRLGEADVVYVLRMQNERMQEAFIPSLGEYAARYQINHARLRPGQLVMHPGPVNRGVEISARRDRLRGRPDRRAGQGRRRGAYGCALRAPGRQRNARGGGMSKMTTAALPQAGARRRPADQETPTCSNRAPASTGLTMS